MAERTGLLPVIGSAEALGGVLNKEQAVLFTDGNDDVIIAGIAQDIHSHHGLGSQLPLRQHCLDLPLQAFRTQAVGVGRDVTKHGDCAEHLGRLRGGDEGHVRAEYRVSRAHARHHIGDLQGVGAVGTRDAVLAAGEGCQLLLQLFDIGTADENRTVYYRLDIGVDPRFQGMILGFQINKLHIIPLSFYQTVLRGCLPQSCRPEHPAPPRNPCLQSRLPPPVPDCG